MADPTGTTASHPKRTNLIAASIHEKYSEGPSIRPICTRYCFTMTCTIQVYSNFHRAGVFITDTRPDELRGDTGLGNLLGGPLPQ